MSIEAKSPQVIPTENQIDLGVVDLGSIDPQMENKDAMVGFFSNLILKNSDLSTRLTLAISNIKASKGIIEFVYKEKPEAEQKVFQLTVG